MRMWYFALLVCSQAIAAFVLVGDVSIELMDEGLTAHTILESLATITLFCGIVFGVYEIRRNYRQLRKSDAALTMASGGFSQLVHRQFDEWDLTKSEADVALLTLKGFDAGEIAKMRGTAAGTVRAQLGRVYKKSGTNSRGQFVSMFIDALLDEPILPVAAE